MEFIESVKISEEEIKNVNLRSNEVNEILGQPPRRIIRYGIGVITTILMVVFGFTFIFKYPDIIYGKFFIQSSNPPVFMMARVSGKVQSLHVQDKEVVKKGELLLTIENATAYVSYQHLKELLKDSVIVVHELPDLGELQSYYGNYQKACSELASFRNLNYHHKKIQSLEKQKLELIEQIRFQHRHVNAAKINNELSENLFNRDSLLFKTKTIAAATFEKSKKELVQQRMAFISTEISLSNTKSSLSSIEQQILELQLNYEQQSNNLIFNYNNALSQLNGAVDKWENSYCIFSPIEGKVAFSGIWEVNQNVIVGQHILTVLPNKKAKILAKVSIPIDRAGKVKVGQEVNLKLSDFPNREYGMLVSELISISEVPDSFYVGTIELPDSLVTNYGKVLPFKQNSQGMAEIITEDLTLAERLLFPLKEIFKKHL